MKTVALRTKAFHKFAYVNRHLINTWHQWRIQDFPWGANPKVGCANLLFVDLFFEICMKMKEIGPKVSAHAHIHAYAVDQQ